MFGNQLAVPSQDGVRRDNRGDASQQAATEWLAFGCETLALVVSQPWPLVAELLFEYADHFRLVVDDVCLISVHPASERGE